MPPGMSEQGVGLLIREVSKRMFKNNQFLTSLEQAEAPLVSRTGVQVSPVRAGHFCLV